jgi:fatty-acyl-CoA synthase/long-chain acyl-CoA synthetase
VTYPLTVKHLMVAAMDRFGHRTALIHDDQSYSYADLAERANQLGHALVALGISPGDPVAICLENGVDYVVADQAIARIGAARVALTDMLSAKDIAYCLSDSQATVAIAGGAMLAAAGRSGSPSLRTILAVGDSGAQPDGATADGSTERPPAIVRLSDVVSGQPSSLPDSSASETDLGLIIYTGGTTGKSKGVMHQQTGLSLNLLSHLIEAGIGEDERVLLTSPLPHASGFLLQAAFLRGATVFLDQKYDPGAVLRRISDDRVTFTFMVPTMIYRLLDAITEDRDNSLDLSALRTILYGAAPITEDRLEQGLHIFGPVFVQLYGQTEAPNFLTRLRREDHTTDPRFRHRLSSCGQAVTMARIEIVDADNPARRDLAPGEVGEVIASAPYTMSGYHNLGEATSKALRDGWLYTGDIGRLDADGYLYLLDRKNDMIISGGMNVYTTEVEGVVAAIDGVKQVAVTGVPHPDWGEAVVAFVVAEDETDTDVLIDRIMGTCRTDLAKYKVPKEVFFADTPPTTAFGKVDKKALRASIPD